MKTYTINDGCSFRVSDTKVLYGGERIELEDDVAAAHRDKVTLVPDEEQAPQDGEGSSSDAPLAESSAGTQGGGQPDADDLDPPP